MPETIRRKPLGSNWAVDNSHPGRGPCSGKVLLSDVVPPSIVGSGPAFIPGMRLVGAVAGAADGTLRGTDLQPGRGPDRVPTLHALPPARGGRTVPVEEP